MMVPSRSINTAGHSASVMFAVLAETGHEFVSCHRCCSKFSEDNRVAVVGNFGRFKRSRYPRESERKECNCRVASAGAVENLPCLRRDIMRRLVLLKEHHPVLAQSDEDIFGFPFLEEHFAGASKIGVFGGSPVCSSPGNPRAEKRFHAVWLNHRHTAPIDR